MKHLAIAVLLFAAACSSSDNNQPVYSPRNRPPADGGGMPAANRPMAGGLDMLPPADWWHQPILVDAVKLTADQMAALDKVARDQADEIARLERDSMVAVRDLRTSLESNQPVAGDIIAAGQRLRSLRDTLFDRQLQMLAAERQILSLDQWQTLQQQLQERRSQRNQDQGYPRRGRGGMGGRGRRPG
jgi:Spy/CpxP family protein refolding chaperone